MFCFGTGMFDTKNVLDWTFFTTAPHTKCFSEKNFATFNIFQLKIGENNILVYYMNILGI